MEILDWLRHDVEKGIEGIKQNTIFLKTFCWEDNVRDKLMK